MRSNLDRCPICGQFHPRPDLSCVEARIVVRMASEVAELITDRGFQQMTLLVDTIARVLREGRP